MTVALFLFGLILLWGGSEVVTRNITPLAKAFGVRELIVTILGVSVLSSLPELTVSTFAILRGAGDVAVGNVIGSNFVTLTFVTAVCALVRPIDIHRDVQERESSWMVLSSALVLLLSMDGLLARSDGMILLSVYLPYLFNVIRSARTQASSGEAVVDDRGRMIWRSGLFIALGVAGVIVGAKLALDSGTVIGENAGIPAVVMGVVIFAFGTSLPELAISFSATLKQKSDVTIGEVYASNIFTQLVILGICCLIAPMPVDPSLIRFSMPLLVFSAVVIQLFVTSGLRLNRVEALGLLGFYVLFVYSQFAGLAPLHHLLGF